MYRKHTHTVKVALILGLVVLPVDKWGYYINTDLNKQIFRI